jgi:hypothetical protein
MNIEDVARYYIANRADQVPSDLVRNFQKFILDLAQVELQGIDCHYVDFQPYLRGQEVCLEDIRADVNRGNLLISTQFNECDLLGREINMIFRCIHDMHHVKLNADFSWQGECASTRHFMSLTDNFLFKQLLFSEILGQSAVYLYNGQFLEHQKVVLFEQEFLDCFAQGE